MFYDFYKFMQQGECNATSKENEGSSKEKCSFGISDLVKLLGNSELVAGVGINPSKATEWFGDASKREDICKTYKDFIDSLNKVLSSLEEEGDKATATCSELDSHESEIDYLSNLAYESYKGDAYEVIHIWNCFSERLTSNELVSAMEKFLNRVSREELIRVDKLLSKKEVCGVEALYLKVVKNKLMSSSADLEELKRLRALAIQELTANFMRDVDGCNKYYDELERKLLR